MRNLARELDKLLVLVVVAEKGKINEAAEVLHLSQPSVSRAIQKLEDAFGVEIFIRSRQGVRLTKAGALLYDQAARMLRELEDIQVRAKNMGHDLSGNVAIGTYESLAEYLWPDFLIDLQNKHPYLHLSVRTSAQTDPRLDLLSGKIDLLVDAEPQTQSALVSWPLYSDQFLFFVARGSKRSTLSVTGALAENIIFVQNARDENRLTIADHLQHAGFHFARQYCFDSFSTVKRMAIRGMGIAVLPRRLAEEDLQRNVLQSIELNGFPAQGFGRHSIYATVTAENRKSQRLKKLIALLKGHFK